MQSECHGRDDGRDDGSDLGEIWERFGRDERHLSYSLSLCIKAFSKIMGEMRPKQVNTYVFLTKGCKSDISWLFPCENRQKVVPLQNNLETDIVRIINGN